MTTKVKASVLENTSVSAGSYGGPSAVLPVFTVDAQGRLTQAANTTPTGSWNITAAAVTNGVYTTGDQTISGIKTFNSTIVGSVNGNANTVSGYYHNQSLLTTASPQFVAISTSGNITSGGEFIANSDRKLKTDILTIENALNKVLDLRGVTYEKISDGSKCVGVIAQEVQEVIPEVVVEGDDGILSVAYGNMVGLLIEAIKEQQKQIEELKSKLNC